MTIIYDKPVVYNCFLRKLVQKQRRSDVILHAVTNAGTLTALNKKAVRCSTFKGAGEMTSQRWVVAGPVFAKKIIVYSNYPGICKRL